MRTIKEEIRIEHELEMLTESVVEKHLQKLIDQLKRYGYSAKELFKIVPVAWDKIDASRVTVYRDPSDKAEIKEYSNYAKDSDYVIFGIKDGQVGIMFYKGNITYLPTNDRHKRLVLDCWEMRIDSEFYKYDYHQKSIKTKAELMLKLADEVWVINIKGKLGTAKFKNERAALKDGVWDNTPEFYAKWLKNNINKYKKKIEIMRAQKKDEFVPLSEQVMQVIEMISKEMIDMHKNSEYGQWGYNSDLRYALGRINGKCQYAFSNLDDIIRAKHDLEEVKRHIEDYSGYKENGEDYMSSYSKRYNSEINRLKNRLKEIEEAYEEYKQEKEKIIEKLKNK